MTRTPSRGFVQESFKDTLADHYQAHLAAEKGRSASLKLYFLCRVSRSVLCLSGMNDALGTPEILPHDTRHKDLQLAAAVPMAVGMSGDTHAAAALSAAASPPHTHGMVPAAAAPAFLIRAPAFSDLRQLAVAAGPDSLAFWATHYLEAVAVGGSPHTLDAKSRDLKAFVTWFGQAVGTASARAWRVRDTKSYMGSLIGRRLAPTSINRAFATLRHFARWAQEEHALFGTLGLPIRGVEEVPVDEASCKKLDRHEVRALFTAAEDRVTLGDAKRRAAAEDGRADPTRRARPRRDLAMFALLYYTGLRATELVMLRREQYTGSHLLDVSRKGANVTRRLYVPKEARRTLDDYLAHERGRDDSAGEAVPLFLTSRSAGYLLRDDLNEALKRIAQEANKHRGDGKDGGAAPIHLHPHRLRHTFGARHRETSHSDSETAAALGHKSTKYVGRYARKTDEEREAVIEAALDV